MDGTRVTERRNLAVQNKPAPLLAPDMIVGVRERVDSTGAVVRPLDEADVRRKLRQLMDRGARAIVVSLLWSFMNPAHEKRVREIIREEYKEYHIGFVPVVMSHVMSHAVIAKMGDYERSMTAILDAYLQHAMQTEICATWDKLREHGYRGTFLMIHNSGGSADIFKTPASRTFNGGPLAGLMGSAYFASKLGYKNVIAAAMGGTSFDVALVVESSVRNYEFRPVIDRWMVSVTMMQTISIGAGGGSIASVAIASVDRGSQRLTVGPRSAGSIPGSACYDLGGTKPTVTDADVVLGYINPETYYGGQIPLSRGRAERAIRERVAEPLGLPVLCTLDCQTVVCSFNGQEILLNTSPSRCEHMARVFKEKGIKPEWEVFSPEHILQDFSRLIAKGYDEPPYYMNIVLGTHNGFQGAMPYSHDILGMMVRMLPPDCLFCVSAIGPAQLPATTQAILLGGHVRAGLEDNNYYARGRLATNEELVASSVRILRELGHEPASPAGARQSIGLPRGKP